MNWDALGAIAEFVSALGVIITLIYLAIQVRANTKESQLSSINNISNQYTSFLAHITSSEALSELYVRAITGDPKALSAKERSRVVMLFGMILRTLENAHQQHLAGRKDMHNSSFQCLIEKILANPDTENVFK